MSNPSTIWTALSLPLSPVGSIPFVDTDTVTIISDVLNFMYTSLAATKAGSQAPYQLTIRGGLRVAYQDTTNISSIAITLNAPAGRVNMPSGASNMTITNSYCFSTSIVQLQLEDIDATMTRIIPVISGDGGFEVLGNAAAAGVTVFTFNIINVRS